MRVYACVCVYVFYMKPNALNHCDLVQTVLFHSNSRSHSLKLPVRAR